MNIKPSLFLTFAKIGAFTFGGGYAMISLIDRECVDKKEWLTQDEFMDMAAVAETTPGPVAINCATYVGYKKAGVAGAVLATLGVVLPSFAIILLISMLFENFLKYEAVANAFKGIRAAVAVLIIQAGIKMTKAMFKAKEKRAAKITFAAVFFTIILTLNLLEISFSSIYLILIAGFLGLFFFRKREEKK